MKRTNHRPIWRSLGKILLAAVCCAAVLAPALALAAAPAEEEPAPSGGASWAISYVLVGLIIVLGLMCLVRPSKRRERAHPERYGD